MSEFKKGFTPIEYANTYRTRFAIPVPEYIKPEKIGVNLGGLTTLMRVGGISHLRVAGQTDGDTSRFTPTIVGYDSQGNAYAGKKGERVTFPESSISTDEANPNLDSSLFRPHSVTWKNIVINLNINEMAERIRQEDKWDRGVYSTEAWASHLDKDIREGVTDAGLKHLTLGLSKLNWGATVFQYGMMAFWEAQNTQPSLQGMAFRLSFVPQILNLWDYFRYGTKDDGLRWSLFYGPQLDRAILLKIISSRANLVMASSEKPKDNGAQTTLKLPTQITK